MATERNYNAESSEVARMMAPYGSDMELQQCIAGENYHGEIWRVNGCPVWRFPWQARLWVNGEYGRAEMNFPTQREALQWVETGGKQ